VDVGRIILAVACFGTNQ